MRVSGYMFFDPDIDLLTVQSFMNYINQNHTARAMKCENMLRTVEYAFNKVKKTGDINISIRTKTLHFNKRSGLSGDQKRSLASKVNGLIRTFKTVGLIDNCKGRLKNDDKKISKSVVSKETGLCYKTVSRNWEKKLEKIFDEINSYNKILTD